METKFFKRFASIFSIWIGFTMVLLSELITTPTWSQIIMLSGFGISFIFSMILLNPKS